MGGLAPGAGTVTLLGVRFAELGMAEAIAALAARPGDAPFSYVVTPNADHLVRLSRTPSLAPLYAAADAIGQFLAEGQFVAHACLEPGVAVAALALGAIHRDVGHVQKCVAAVLFELGAGRIAARQTDRCGDLYGRAGWGTTASPRRLVAKATMGSRRASASG